MNFSAFQFLQMCFQPQIFTKGNHTICLTENNLCYVWGYNRDGQLGLGHTNNRSTPTLLIFSNNERISFISCGKNYTMCLTENKLCYVWGRNENGQLGLGDTNNRYTPTLLTLPYNERISSIICGYSHTLCLIDDNLCYVWGGNEYGQLGLGDVITRSAPTLFSLPNNERISFITCGANHTICLTQNNLCYVWGYNLYGQLGLGDRNIRLSPTLFSLPYNEKISFITCGLNHTICLTENNLCYVWGRNGFGELGSGDQTDRKIPTLLSFPNNEKISFITCGSRHTICLTENELCYVWGYNSFGQLGLGHRYNRSIPNLLSLPNNERISFVICGFSHTICLTENNLCYVWGYNKYGQLGSAHKKVHSKPILLNSFSTTI